MQKAADEWREIQVKLRQIKKKVQDKGNIPIVVRRILHYNRSLFYEFCILYNISPNLLSK